MAHAATMNEVERYENQLTPGWGKLMMWVFLCSDAMSFAGLLAAYGAVRLGSSNWPVPSENTTMFFAIIFSLCLVHQRPRDFDPR